MLQTFKNGQGSIVLRVKLLDSTATTGAGKTGLSSSSSGLIVSTIADNEATATAYTQAGSTIESITTLGTYAAPTATKVRFKEADATNHKGIYELHIADARFAVSSAKSLLVSISGVTGMAEADFVVQLQSDDPYVAKPTNFNLDSIDSNGRRDIIKIAGTTQTAKDVGGAVPSVAAGASGGLLISGSNAGTTTLAALTITGATTLTGNVALADGLTIAAPSTTNRAGLDITGNGTGAAMKLAAGATGKGVAITTTAGDGLSILPTAGDAIVATGNGTSKHGIRSTGGTAGTSDGISAIAGTGGVPIRGDITGNITGNVSGSAGSVSGAVGSVSGAVGSVTGAVGSVTGNVGGNVTGSVGSIASGGISEASFATTAGSFAPLGIIDQGTAQAATSSTLQIRAAASFGDNTAISYAEVFGSDQGYWQTVGIVSNVGSTDTLTLSAPFGVTPTGTITYKLFGVAALPTALPAVNVTQFGGAAGTFSAGRPEVNTMYLAGQAVTAAAGVTFPTSVASPTNITAGTIATVTNLTNAPTAGDLTATMKTSVQTAADAAVTANASVAAIKAYPDRTVGRGTVSATSPSTTSFTASAMSPSGAVADQFKGRILIFDNATTTAALRGQATDITANTSAALPVFTYTALTTAPASGDTFSIV